MSHSPSDWPALLRDQGRSMTWLAEQVGVSRTYLQDVAAGRKNPSAELELKVTLALGPDRLAAGRDHAAERVRWRDVEARAIALAAAIRVALGNDPQ